MKRIVLFILLITLLTACSTAQVTPAPTTELPVSTATTLPTEMVIEPTVTAVPTAEPTAAPMAMEASPFNISVAQYFLDSAGFHGMAESISTNKTIDATYLSTVNRVKNVLVQTTWPAELNGQATAFIKTLGEFGAALDANDVDNAIKTSDLVHDAQHELSHTIDDWAVKSMVGTGTADPFNVAVAQYFLDSAGFHGMAETLTTTKIIDATYLSKTNRVKKVLVQTTWPTELKDQAQDFIKSLGEFGTALEANNIDDAIKTSDAVHEAQHDLSHAIDEWNTTTQPISAEADPFKVSVAQYLLDSAGFHGMAETLADSKEIDPTYLPAVNRVKKVLAQTVWPADLNEQAKVFIDALNSFAAALSDNKVDEAIAASETVHDAQHELSHSIDPWLGINAQAH